MMTNKSNPPVEVSSSTELGPSVPNEVMLYVHTYGDSRADDDGLSGLRIGEAVLALRRWAAQLQAAERERCSRLAETLTITPGETAVEFSKRLATAMREA